MPEAYRYLGGAIRIVRETEAERVASLSRARKDFIYGKGKVAEPAIEEDERLSLGVSVLNTEIYIGRYRFSWLERLLNNGEVDIGTFSRRHIESDRQLFSKYGKD